MGKISMIENNPEPFILDISGGVKWESGLFGLTSSMKLDSMSTTLSPVDPATAADPRF
jgi:hypothetical protein